tara:strand:+ start:38 stop:382 length:345 start_codon:yes stop_codon:yes gene_type:complete
MSSYPDERVVGTQARATATSGRKPDPKAPKTKPTPGGAGKKQKQSVVDLTLGWVRKVFNPEPHFFDKNAEITWRMKHLKRDPSRLLRLLKAKKTRKGGYLPPREAKMLTKLESK